MKRNKRFVLLAFIMLVLMSQESTFFAMGRKTMDGAEITKEESYRIGLSEEQFEALVSHAHIVCPDLTATGFEALAVVGKDVRAAKKLYRTLLRDYEWAPCDPAERVAFLRCRSGVFRIKGSAEEVNAFVGHLKEKGKVTKRILINSN